MNIDNQLLLGIVFITAGVAMGLLAYAAFLNRQQEGEEAMDLEQEPQMDPLEPPIEEMDEAPLASEAGEEPIPPTSAPEPLAEAEPVSGAEADQVEPEAPSAAPAPTSIPGPSPTMPAAVDQPAVLVDRDNTTNRLMIKVDDRVYKSMEQLQESEDWPKVTDLFSDLLAWMIKGESATPEAMEQEEDQPGKPGSMVQQINDILGEKLADRDSGPQAVRLMEGVGGSIRVYIGVESYSIDEVPDEEVKALIRQAVAEWEARQ
ncbi:MAG: hypothetical protein ACLFWD_08975 [Anaerolineales bacterium]